MTNIARDIIEENKTRIGLPVLQNGKVNENSVVLDYDAELDVLTYYRRGHICKLSGKSYRGDCVELPQKSLRHFMTLILSEVKDD